MVDVDRLIFKVRRLPREFLIGEALCSVGKYITEDKYSIVIEGYRLFTLTQHELRRNEDISMEVIERVCEAIIGYELPVLGMVVEGREGL